MTFDELMDKYLPLIERAASVQDNATSFDLALAALALSVRGDLQGALEGENLDKGAMMAAKELVSRFTLPEGSGAGFEGSFGSYSEVETLNPIDATIEAPVLVVEVRQPGTNTLVTQKGGKLVYRELEGELVK